MCYRVLGVTEALVTSSLRTASAVPQCRTPRAVTVLESALELVRKYDVPGPRYISYPTAPHFAADCDRQALLT